MKTLNKQTIQEIMDEPVIIKTWELTADKVNHGNTFMTFDILPALMFIIDKQMAEYYKEINEKPVISYSIIFQWLGFYIDLTYNRKL